MVAEASSPVIGDGGVPVSRGARRDQIGGSSFRRDQLVEVQRSRILAGAVQAVSERGASNIAIAEIVQRAGVSRRTFYDLFADRDDCLAATFEDVLGVAEASVLAATQDQDGWLARLRAGVNAFMFFLDEQPQLGRFLVCDSLTGGRVLAEWRAGVVARLVAFVDEGRDQTAQAAQVPSMQANGSVGGVLAILQNLLASEEPVSFIELAPSLVAMIVTPYLGRTVARRELERPAPPTQISTTPSTRSMSPVALKDVGMRLTYRTMRVLLAIAEHPGASNRQIGELAEIGDQGQISKLLRRLQRADLVLNDGLAPGQGAPNVWRLTATGRRLTDGVGAGAVSVSPLRQSRGKHNPRREK